MHKEKNFDFFFLNFIEETKMSKKFTTIKRKNKNVLTILCNKKIVQKKFINSPLHESINYKKIIILIFKTIVVFVILIIQIPWIVFEQVCKPVLV